MTIKEFVTSYTTKEVNKEHLQELIEILEEEEILEKSLIRIRRDSKQKVIKDLLSATLRDDYRNLDRSMKKQIILGVIFSDLYVADIILKADISFFKFHKVDAHILDVVDTRKLDRNLGDRAFTQNLSKAYQLIKLGAEENYVYKNLLNIGHIDTLAFKRLCRDSQLHLTEDTNPSTVMIEVLNKIYGKDSGIENDYHYVTDKLKTLFPTEYHSKAVDKYIRQATLILLETVRLSKDKTLTLNGFVDTVMSNNLINNKCFELYCFVSLIDFTSTATYLKLNLSQTDLFHLLVELCLADKEEILSIIENKDSLYYNHNSFKTVMHIKSLLDNGRLKDYEPLFI